MGMGTLLTWSREQKGERVIPAPWQPGAIAAVLVLASQAVRLFPLPTRMLQFPLPGLLVTLPIGPGALVALFIVLFAFSGMDWLLSQHPRYRRSRLWVHAGLPILTAWMLEVALLSVPPTYVWWVVLLTGALVLVGVLVAEYLSLSTEHPAYWSLQFGLGGLGIFVFFLLAMFTRMAGWRLLWTLPTLTLVGGFLAMRMFYLLAFERFLWPETLTVSVLLGHGVMAFFLITTSTLSFALLSAGWLYVLFSCVRNLWEGDPWYQALRDPLLVAAVLGGVLLWLRLG